MRTSGRTGGSVAASLAFGALTIPGSSPGATPLVGATASVREQLLQPAARGVGGAPSLERRGDLGRRQRELPLQPPDVTQIFRIALQVADEVGRSPRGFHGHRAPLRLWNSRAPHVQAVPP